MVKLRTIMWSAMWFGVLIFGILAYFYQNVREIGLLIIVFLEILFIIVSLLVATYIIVQTPELK